MAPQQQPRMTNLAGRPPFATDIPDEAYHQQNATSRRRPEIVQPALFANRKSEYGAFDNYYDEDKKESDRHSGIGAVGMGFLNGDMSDDDSDDDVKPSAPQPKSRVITPPAPAATSPTRTQPQRQQTLASPAIRQAAPPAYTGTPSARTAPARSATRTPPANGGPPGIAPQVTRPGPVATQPAQAQRDVMRSPQKPQPQQQARPRPSNDQPAPGVSSPVRQGLRPTGPSPPPPALSPPPPGPIRATMRDPAAPTPARPRAEFIQPLTAPTKEYDTPMTPTSVSEHAPIIVKFGPDSHEDPVKNKRMTMLGDDFWARVTRAANEERQGKTKSPWLKEYLGGRSRLNVCVWITSIIILLAIFGGIGVGWYFSHNTPASAPKALGGSANENSLAAPAPVSTSSNVHVASTSSHKTTTSTSAGAKATARAMRRHRARMLAT